MNNTATTATPATTATAETTGDTEAPAIDPRPALAKAIAIGRDVVAGIRPEQFGDPTPCTEFDVRQLSGHLVAVLNKIAMLGGGGSFFAAPDSIDDVADTDLVQAYEQYADGIGPAWSDDSSLGRLVDLPWAQLPGAVTLMIYTNEITVHTWDLAKATGQQAAWDDEVIQVAYTAIQRGLPAEGRTAQYDEAAESMAAKNMPEEFQGFGAPFAEVVPVADDAPLIDRLVAWNGRQP